MVLLERVVGLSGFWLRSTDFWNFSKKNCLWTSYQKQMTTLGPGSGLPRDPPSVCLTLLLEMQDLLASVVKLSDNNIC